jgi:enamine deaminase RidA (YjgF/YER057c/UK114 family)
METLHTRHDPAGSVGAASRYSQAVETAPGLRWLHLSGQIGMAPDGTVAADAGGQHARTWANVLALLEAAGMDASHLVRVNAYVTSADEVPRYREARDRALAGACPASTLVIVAGLVLPELVVEIEATAAAPA